MTNTKLLTAFSALALVALPTAVHAQDYQDAIEVRAISPLADWQKASTASLNKALARSTSIANANESIVQVGFTVGIDGKAKGVHVLPGDGNPAAERAAVYAVNSLDTLDELPVTDNSRPILANIIFYKSDAAHRRMAGELARSERVRMSDATMDDYLVIGAAPAALDAN